MGEKIFVAVHPVRTVMRSRRSRRLFTASRKAAGRLLFVLCKFTLNLFAHLVCLIKKKKVTSLENSSYLLSASLSQSGHGQSVKTLPGNTDWLTSVTVRFLFQIQQHFSPLFFRCRIMSISYRKTTFHPSELLYKSTRAHIQTLPKTKPEHRCLGFILEWEGQVKIPTCPRSILEWPRF